MARLSLGFRVVAARMVKVLTGSVPSTKDAI